MTGQQRWIELSAGDLLLAQLTRTLRSFSAGNLQDQRPKTGKTTAKGGTTKQLRWPATSHNQTNRADSATLRPLISALWCLACGSYWLALYFKKRSIGLVFRLRLDAISQHIRPYKIGHGCPHVAGCNK